MNVTAKIRNSLHSVAQYLFGSYERRMITLLFLVFVLDFADRSLLGALGPTLKRTFHLNNFEFGLLSAAFAFVGAGASIPVGMLTDKLNRTRIIAVGLVLWCVAVGLVGASVSFAMLFIFRLFLGAVAATSGPTVPSLVGNLEPTGKRSRALGFIDSGQLIGTGLGFLLPVIVTAFLSWRYAFWILAVFGALLAVGFWRAREPERTGATGPESDSAEESQVRRHVRESGVQPTPRAMVHKEPREMSIWEVARYVFRVRTDLIVLITRSFGDYFLAAIGAFAVIFATQWYHISQSAANIAILVLGLGALAGMLVVGRLADWLLARGHVRSRIWLGAAGYLIAPLIVFPAFITHSITLAVLLFAAGGFCLAGSSPTLDSARIDVLVPRLRGRSESIRRAIRTVAEGFAPLLTGIIAEQLLGGGVRGLQIAFLVTLPAVFIAGLVTLAALRTYQGDVAAAIVSSEQLGEG